MIPIAFVYIRDYTFIVDLNSNEFFEFLVEKNFSSHFFTERRILSMVHEGNICWWIDIALLINANSREYCVDTTISMAMNANKRDSIMHNSLACQVSARYEINLIYLFVTKQ